MSDQTVWPFPSAATTTAAVSEGDCVAKASVILYIHISLYIIQLFAYCLEVKWYNINDVDV